MAADGQRAQMLRSMLVVIALGLIVVTVGAAWLRQALDDPSVIFLQSEGDAVWLRPDRPFNGSPQPGPIEVRTDYRTSFDCASPVTGGVLHYRALRTADVQLNGARLATFAPAVDWDSWREVRSVSLPDLSRGPHQLEMTVLNHNGPALLQAWCDELDLSTTNDWQTRISDADWTPAKPVTRPWIPGTARQAPSVRDAMRSRGLGIAAILGLWLGFLWWIGRCTRTRTNDSLPVVAASRVRWGIIGLWVVLAFNNELKLPFFGFDSKAHSDYMRFILEHRRIPLANEGWQMFQAPLYHLFGAAIYGPISSFFRESYGWHAVRLMTMACGVLQVEVCYRAVRRIFPGRDDVQIMGTIAGGLMPMNVYMSQALGNEPLAGLLSAMTIVIGLGILDGQNANSRRWPLWLGVTWGLAMLTKVTPLLLGVPLLVMCLRGMIGRRMASSRIMGAAISVLGGAILVCGWYYLRNWVLLGQPFVGGWDPVRGIEWWQDPGYRVAEHFLAFGEALRNPIYAGHAGLWDGLYSTMWLDGYLLGTSWDGRPPWNDTLLICTAPLALIPMLTMLTGALRACVTRKAELRWPLLLCLLTIGIYLAAIASLYLKLPIYSAAKGTYFLGLLPCFAILVAAGCDAVRAYRIPWTVLQAALLTWATCVYATYFIL